MDSTPGTDGTASTDGAPLPFDPAAGLVAARAASAATRPGTPMGRFAKTDTTFGLPGRIVLTVLLLIPLAWFIYLLQWLIAAGGLVIYGFVILPIALRDVWRPARRR